jgi:hypothetical protein
MWREDLSRYLRRSSTWVALRQLQYEGMWRANRRWRLWSRVLSTPPIITEPVGQDAPVEVHVLCYGRDYLCALWALKSFYHFARVSYPLVIHVQGDVPRRVTARLHRHFPAARLILQAEADATVEAWLRSRGLLRVLAARQRTPFMLKLTDFPVMSESAHLLTLDSDVLFFRFPAELVMAARAPSSITLFQRDPESTYNISEERALSQLGIRLAPKVNTGIMVFPRDSLDLIRCEEYLGDPDVARPSGWIEQTLHALCASEHGRVAYLPESYLVSLETDVNLDSLVARHYAGPSRPLLTSEGMQALIRAGFLDQLKKQ